MYTARIMAAIPAPTPATSEDTRMLDWLLAYRCTVARYDSGPNWGSAYTQHFLDRQALRAAMAHAGEQKT